MASDTSRPTDGSTATGTPETDDAAGSVATDRATADGPATTATDTADGAATGTTATGSTTAGSTATDGTATGSTAAAGAATDDAGTGRAARVRTAAATPAGTPADTASGGGLAGAGAVVAAGLGLASLTGTSVGDMLRERESLVGQIQAATGSPGDTIESFYGAPWDVAAVVNGVVALVAVLVGLVLVLGPAARPAAGAWVRPVALGGLVLGVLGLLVSGGMYLDLFASTPVLPQMPGIPGLG
ncbi:hypothetical protein ND486_12390 [Pseudonocardia sp. DR1-2]|uniref:hypothetical protein n=1 Tax=Pseudonocardia sp. DR1-2 TaxID=2951168 RepID=UPI002042CEED|nr:hypothetical protein [Pseudonocardia sp. DR1-2]MCM3846990.1 hypothetical protein [Pseudonocardia sp. DR1-2]